MKLLSLKLKDEVFEETERVVEKMSISRNAYINKALELFNQFNKRKLLKAKLYKESALVSPISLSVLSEFEKLEDD